MYFESHAHYDDKRYDSDRDELLNSLKDSGVEFVINSGASMHSSKKGIELSKKYDFMYCAVGVHPHDTNKIKTNDMNILQEYTKEKKVVAIGEIGLDFYYDHSERDVQEYWFKKQLDLARDTNLPVIIHSRDADALCFDIIKEADLPKKGVIHCFSGSKELALEYVKLGYYIGVGGVVTFNTARKLLETVDTIGLENILIETDCPYLTPAPNRGKRNDSTNLKYIVDKIAQIKNITPEHVSNSTKENAIKLFF